MQMLRCCQVNCALQDCLRGVFHMLACVEIFPIAVRGERAKTMLLHYNRGLVRQFVWRCKGLGTEVSFGELALAGDDALLKAAIKWDAKKGARFTTYAFQRINRSAT